MRERAFLLFVRGLFATVLLCLGALAQAQLSIEITGAGANRLPVAVAIFQDENQLPQAVTDVVRADLERSGMFRVVDAGRTPLGEKTAVNFGDWKSRGADALVVGTVIPVQGGRYEVRFRLYDSVKQADLGGQALVMTAAQHRPTGHRIADYVYEKLIGEPGVFSTRVSYVAKVGRVFELRVSDADGSGERVALRSPEPIISPAWSPDGTKLAYVSFESKKPVVYVQNLATGQKQVVANFRGSNSAPAWSPDGKRLAVVLTKDGGSQMYTLNADGSGVQRLATSSGIDTEPQYSADGQWIYFTSDRGGSPQIYRIPVGGGAAQRITIDGSYNVTPRLSPDGRTMAFIARNSGRFQLSVMDLSSRQVQVLSESVKDESPSFSPNGRMIMYASEIGGRGVLAAVSVDGKVKQRLTVQAADIREPAWGPLGK